MEIRTSVRFLCGLLRGEAHAIACVGSCRDRLRAIPPRRVERETKAVPPAGDGMANELITLWNGANKLAWFVLVHAQAA